VELAPHNHIVRHSSQEDTVRILALYKLSMMFLQRTREQSALDAN
jgi:hypothetical protein